MRPKPKILLRSAWISLLTGFIITSCNKNPYELGLDLLPPSDTIYVSMMDTVTVQAFSVREDSIRTDEMPSLILGSVLDPVFGKTTASFCSQFFLYNEETDFGTNPHLDSLVLLLYYETPYGDTNTIQQLRVFELSEDLILDSSYYSNQLPGIYGIELANLTYAPRPNVDVIIGGDTLPPHLRINLSGNTNYLGNKILYAPSNVLSSNTEFIKFMKGLYVEAMPVGSRGALVDYSSSEGLTRLVLYFHNDDEDSLSIDLPIATTAARYNMFDHNGYLDAGPELKQQILYKDTLLGKDRLYLQTMSGVKIILRIPYIRSLDSLGPIAINSAILKFRSPDPDTSWIPPPELAMYKVDTAGKLGVIIDELDGTDYFGGIYNADDHAYWFRLTRHIQRLLVNDTLRNYDLCLYASDPLDRSIDPGRVILNGTDPFDASATVKNLKLTITYTKK